MENSIVLSTRIRLARNFKNYPFISKLNKEDAQKVVDSVKNVILESNEKSSLLFKEINSEMLKKDGPKLIEAHIISPNILNSSVPSCVITDKNEEISIMVNEEDHLRIQVIKQGLDFEGALFLANACDDLIEEKNEYAFLEKYGYLTSCPTNLGTGMRASVMLHLPAIVLSGRINELIRNVNRLGIAIRGFYGEGSEALGNIFQVSNQITLGISEEEIIKKLKNVVETIIKEEEHLRNEIKGDQLYDRVLRSYGILKNCYLISYNEFIKLWSNVYLGVDLQIIKPSDISIFKNLITTLAPNHIGLTNSSERDKKRAEILKEVI